MTKAELDFVNEMTRQLLVGWCQKQLEQGKLYGGDIPDDCLADLMDETKGKVVPNPFVEHAIAKGWVSKDKTRVLSVGFSAAASFLRR